MSCESIEISLSAYMENDLPAEDMRKAEAHLAKCNACRKALEDLMFIEGALLKRREEVPQAGKVAKAVIAGVGISRTKRVLDLVFSLPFLISISFAILGVVLLVNRHWIRSLFSRDLQMPQEYANAGERLMSMIVQFAGGDVWILTAVYLGLTAIIVLGTGLMVLNFMRTVR
ncbi:MAG: hypothetical protein GTO42_08810 [Candidatus Latescibacteria bacterium]|nr:hypothetical protein [Candidatus Latescibacterota bacterium]NIO29061.1 hypothetical protein [Candidatus Latescibacterota bacterium]NIO56686.1 hypothetical protein [Candidatus Latescibacterota bacterium]NIT02269.1 hypothetical protein [Candidatus Latescibacterota bacterium]NIT39154.1 hypothetical protein [Candidatus Latescibacterota bacterium]